MAPVPKPLWSGATQGLTLGRLRVEIPCWVPGNITSPPERTHLCTVSSISSPAKRSREEARNLWHPPTKLPQIARDLSEFRGGLSMVLRPCCRGEGGRRFGWWGRPGPGQSRAERGLRAASLNAIIFKLRALLPSAAHLYTVSPG